MLSPLLQVLLFVVLVSHVVAGLVTAAVWLLQRRRLANAPTRWPSVSILKPLAGLEDEDLLENLESHLRLDYPGEVEVLLGVRTERDAAWPVARAFAAKYPGRVRVVLQEGEPGLNPKVNQLLTLTRHARHELLCITDSNVRVAPGYLREHVTALQSGPDVGLTSNAFFGVEEASVGAALDNLTLATHTLGGLAAAEVLLRTSQIVSKSVVLTREALAAVGGWDAFRDVLAEDQRLGRALAHAGYRTVLCPTAVRCVQRHRPVAHFWGRQSRWAMIRHTLLQPAVWMEPLLNPTVPALLLLVAAAGAPWAWALLASSMLFSVLQAAFILRLGREPMPLRWLLLTPLRDVLLFGTFVTGAFMDRVSWRGNAFSVGEETLLSPLVEATPAMAASRASAVR